MKLHSVMTFDVISGLSIFTLFYCWHVETPTRTISA